MNEKKLPADLRLNFFTGIATPSKKDGRALIQAQNIGALLADTREAMRVLLHKREITRLDQAPKDPAATWARLAYQECCRAQTAIGRSAPLSEDALVHVFHAAKLAGWAYMHDRISKQALKGKEKRSSNATEAARKIYRFAVDALNTGHGTASKNALYNWMLNHWEPKLEGMRKLSRTRLAAILNASGFDADWQRNRTNRLAKG